MTRTQLTNLFLATLDEIAEAPHFAGGSPGKPTLDCDTVMSILLEQVDNWHRVPYPAIRAMFEALLGGAPLHDVERLVASVSEQLQCAEQCAAEAANEAEAREAAALLAAQRAVNALASDPETLRLFVGMVPLLGNRALSGEEGAEAAS